MVASVSFKIAATNISLRRTSLSLSLLLLPTFNGPLKGPSPTSGVAALRKLVPTPASPWPTPCPITRFAKGLSTIPAISAFRLL